MIHSSKVIALAALGLLAAPASAQQFNRLPGLLPGTPRWSEGVEAVDVDNDGDLDLLFADGDGFTSAGTKRQNVLLINQLIETGASTFTDESVARLGANSSNAKGVTTGDVNGDGWADVLFANAFSTDTPFLYINRGAAQPGVFDLLSPAASGLTLTLSSGGAQFGDVDDDGDLDLLISHAYLGSGNGRPKLYFNDGTGFFTQNAAALGAPQKSAQMDVQLVDVDNDMDLDFFGVCRANNAGGKHYLMLNDGTGTFTDISATLPTTSSNVYEAEAGDLDGDDDIDLFFISLTGFGEGAFRNDLVPSTTLGFTSMGGLADNTDDNEVALFDYDMDGDFDMFIASLGGTEALWRNDGAMSFTKQSTQIQSVGDPSLDITVADINNDGKYDLITANGEGAPSQYENKVYRNDGAADTIAPKLIALDSPAMATPSEPVKVRAKIRDQVLDDGVNYVSTVANYVINTGANTTSVDIQAGGFVPAVINVTAGAHVIFTNTSGANQSVTSATAPYTFDSSTLLNGQSWEQIFVSPGTYSVMSSPSSLMATVNVTGTADTVKATYTGGNIYRALMPDTAGGAGIELVYELVFTDWAGNVLVTNNLSVSKLDCTVSTYCTAGTSASGCTATLSATGTASLSAGSGFTVTASAVEGSKDGLFFYGTNGQQGNAWGSGTSFQCVTPPVQRAGILTGSGTNGMCNGSFNQDFNAFWATAVPGKVPALGQEVSMQLWYRDPQNTSNQTTSLSDALRFRVCP